VQQDIANLLDRLNLNTSIRTLHELGILNKDQQVRYIAQQLNCTEDLVRRVAAEIGYTLYAHPSNIIQEGDRYYGT
jgi:hypothetical protein